MKPAHHFPIRVYYEDTDFSGVVYHASYLRFMERGRTEYLRAAGILQGELLGGPDGYHFAVRRMTIDWLRPALMDDELLVVTEVAALKGASFHLRQAVKRGDVVLVTADVTIAGLRAGRPARLPEPVRRALLATAAADGG